MTRDKLWRKFAARNPSFDGDGSVTLSARGLRKLFAQTWDFAYEAGMSGEGEDTDGTESVPPSEARDDSRIEELLRMFGMKK